MRNCKSGINYPDFTEHTNMKLKFLCGIIPVLILICCQVKIERKSPLTGLNISTKNFKISDTVGFLAADTLNFLANGKATSDKFLLDTAIYNLFLNAKGTQAYNVFPKIKVYLNDKLIGDPQLGGEYNVSAVEFKVDKKDIYHLSIQFDSDGLDDKGNDRNVLIQSISIQKK